MSVYEDPSWNAEWLSSQLFFMLQKAGFVVEVKLISQEWEDAELKAIVKHEEGYEGFNIKIEHFDIKIPVWGYAILKFEHDKRGSIGLEPQVIKCLFHNIDSVIADRAQYGFCLVEFNIDWNSLRYE